MRRPRSSTSSSASSDGSTTATAATVAAALFLLPAATTAFSVTCPAAPQFVTHDPHTRTTPLSYTTLQIPSKTIIHKAHHRTNRHQQQLWTARKKTIPMTCELERLPKRVLRRVVPQGPTLERWAAAYRPRPGQPVSVTGRSRFVDSLGLTMVVWFMAYFASRTLLIAFSTSGVLAWRASWLIVFLRAVLVPLLETGKRSAELWGDREMRDKTRGALFTGRVTRTGFALASETSDHCTHFQMLVEDEEGRELLFDVPQAREYREVRRGMRCEVVVLSRSKGFSKLTGVTEAYLPELELFVGRHSLLDKRAFWRLLQAREEREHREVETGNSSIVRRKSKDRRKRIEPSPSRNGDGWGGGGRGDGGGRGHTFSNEELQQSESLRRRVANRARERATMMNGGQVGMSWRRGNPGWNGGGWKAERGLESGARGRGASRILQ